MHKDDNKGKEFQNQINLEKQIEEQLSNSHTNDKSQTRFFKESTLKVYNTDDKLSIINETNVNYENESIFQPK